MQYSARTFALLQGLVFISLSLNGQMPPAIERYLNALGGVNKLDVVKTAKVFSNGKFINGIDTLRYSSETLFQRPNKVYLKTVYPFGSKTKLFDGSDFWESTFLGDPRKLEDGERKIMLERYLNFGIEDLVFTAQSYFPKADTTISQFVYERCSIVTANGWELECYFDPNTHLMDHYTFNKGFNVIKLANYKNFDGLLFATKVIGSDGTLITSTIDIVSIALNIDIDSEMFKAIALRK